MKSLFKRLGAIFVSNNGEEGKKDEIFIESKDNGYGYNSSQFPCSIYSFCCARAQLSAQVIRIWDMEKKKALHEGGGSLLPLHTCPTMVLVLNPR